MLQSDKDTLVSAVAVQVSGGRAVLDSITSLVNAIPVDATAPSDLQAQIASLVGQVSSLNSRVNALELDKSQLQGKIDMVRAAIA